MSLLTNPSPSLGSIDPTSLRNAANDVVRSVAVSRDKYSIWAGIALGSVDAGPIGIKTIVDRDCAGGSFEEVGDFTGWRHVVWGGDCEDGKGCC